MTNIREQLTPILDATTIMSPAAFVFCNEDYPVMPASPGDLPGFPNHPLPSNPLVRALQMVLYARCYSRRLKDDVASAPVATLTAWDPSFVHQLSQANHTTSRWEGGWTIYATMPTGQVSLIKGDRQRSAMPGEFIHAGPPGFAPQPGAIVSVQVLRESTVAQPGFYFVYSETLSDMWDEHALLRFYFNAPSTAASTVLDNLTSQLNRYQVPFRMKALNSPAMYDRTDAIVLYVARRYYEICVRVIRRLSSPVADELRRPVPLFTQQILPGVGLAEEPNTGESFGMHRCRLTSEGVVDAWMVADQSSAGRVEAIAKRFQQGGFSLETPHLSPGSIDFPEVLEKVDLSYE